MIKALIFDFDGLILDTETIDLQSWQEIYCDHGAEFPISRWMDSLGGSSDLFDPYFHLITELKINVNKIEIRAKKECRDKELLNDLNPLPGVKELIDAADRLDIKLAVASSSERAWVISNLSRLCLLKRFQCIKCADDVIKTKPAPDLFEAVLRELGLKADQAIVFEDSPNGIQAANRAKIFCVAVPNAVTSHLSLDHADLIVDSLVEISLEDLIKKGALCQ